MKALRLDRVAGATFLLALLAPVAVGATDAICFWRARYLQSSPGAFQLAAYADGAAGLYLLAPLAFAAWAIAIAVHVRRTAASRRSPLHWLVPLGVFAAFAWNTARYGYACNPF